MNVMTSRFSDDLRAIQPDDPYSRTPYDLRVDDLGDKRLAEVLLLSRLLGDLMLNPPDDPGGFLLLIQRDGLLSFSRRFFGSLFDRLLVRVHFPACPPRCDLLDCVAARSDEFGFANYEVVPTPKTLDPLDQQKSPF